MIEKMIEAWSSYSWQVKTCLILCIIFLVAILIVAIYDTLEELKDD